MSDIDHSSLALWLETNVTGFSKLGRMDQFPGGQSNPTYRLAAGDAHYVLKRKPFGKLLQTAHAIDREYRLSSVLHAAGYPVARPIVYCQDETVIGSEYYIMDFVDGQVHQDVQLGDVAAADRSPCYRALVNTLAKLHTIDHAALGLTDFGRSTNYVQRQIKRWTEQYRTSQTEDIPEVEKLIEWLPLTAPPQSWTSIIHGDFRLDNVVFETGRPAIRAVLDWELATLGDPLADFTYFALSWIKPQHTGFSLSGVDLAANSLPTLDQVINLYAGAVGWEPPSRLHWYFAYNMFRLVGISQGIKARMKDGNASSEEAASAAAMILPLARAAWDEARKAGAKS